MELRSCVDVVVVVVVVKQTIDGAGARVATIATRARHGLFGVWGDRHFRRPLYSVIDTDVVSTFSLSLSSPQQMSWRKSL